MTAKKTGRPEHVPTKLTRDTVSLHAMVGTPQEQICDILDITEKTLRKHYRKELDLSLAKANASIGGKLYGKAMAGDSAAIFFWMKTRAGFSEKQEIDMTSSDNSMTPSVIHRIIIENSKKD